MRYSCRLLLFVLIICVLSCNRTREAPLTLTKDAHIVLIGNNLGSRMMNYGHFETELHLRFPDSTLYIRNMCDPGETAGFRPHPGRKTPWAFPGADRFNAELARNSESEGFFEYPDEWLTRHKADVILAFFGYNESFNGPAGLPDFKAELDSFIRYTLRQTYNGVSAPQLALVSPIAFQDLSAYMDLPTGKKENENLALYTEAMKEVAAKNNVPLIDVFLPTKKWFDNDEEQLTIDGSQLNDDGYKKFAVLLADAAFGNIKPNAGERRSMIHAAVMEKNWMWHNDYKIPNGVHVYGRRYNPFGPENYPAELRKIREMTSNRDSAIWMAAIGKEFDLPAADAKTDTLPEVKTNFNPKENGSLTYLYGNDAMKKFQLAPGYKIELFASEQEFSDLAKPVQMSFDNKGRLWLATMPSYPHYKPGDQKPNDKIIILEDTNSDGKADVQKVFADGLHLPVGFEIAPEGVYVSQGINMVLLSDTDGDDKADKREIVLSGFDDHDTHHAHHAYTVDPSGAIYMGEGVFLHTNVETSYGPVRATNGGFYRYNPQRHHLERTAQLAIPNPWGITFDEWGQNFFAETSSPDVRWMMPGTVKPRYGVATHKSVNLIEQKHMVRPTSGIEMISSRHFPAEVQGDLLINNTIGFLGTKQHIVEDDGTGYKTRHRQDLLRSDDRNFRPVDLEFAPDGSLYLIDWHNILIGHMQHNARDPLRDHVHGRVYRITYPSRPLVSPAKIDGASIDQLLENLKLPEYRTRYRTRRELRARNADEVQSHLQTWITKLDKNDSAYEHHLTEALWVSWGLNRVDKNLVKTLLSAKNFRARAAAVRAVRYNGHQLSEQADLLKLAAADENGRVRLEAIVAASWMDKANGSAVLDVASQKPMDDWMIHAYETARAHLEGREVEEKKEMIGTNELNGINQAVFAKGKELYNKEGYCATCHMADGSGLEQSGFPPLRQTVYVNGDEERLIKIVLKGLQGPIEVNGIKYPGQVPMTPFEGLLNDEEVASVLSYVRNSFGNKSGPVTPAKVKAVREKIKNKKGFYNPAELLKEHPLENPKTAAVK
jgi:mono/diheme cytochrome c family protein/glucose/arabinose dehydrogenase